MILDKKVIKILLVSWPNVAFRARRAALCFVLFLCMQALSTGSTFLHATWNLAFVCLLWRLHGKSPRHILRWPACVCVCERECVACFKNHHCLTMRSKQPTTFGFDFCLYNLHHDTAFPHVHILLHLFFIVLFSGTQWRLKCPLKAGFLWILQNS